MSAGLDSPKICVCHKDLECKDADIKGVEYGHRGPPMYATKSGVRDDYTLKVMDPEDFQSMALAHVKNKHTFRNFERYVNTERRQCEEMVKRQKDIEEQALKEKQVQEANDLARELEAIKREEFKDAKLRQQLRSNSHELRDLERKLKAAYVNKELAAQIAQHEAIKLNEKIDAAKSYEIMSKALVKEKDHQNKLKQEDIIKKAEYKKELQEQLIMREKSKRYLYEEFLREKKLLDDIVKRIHDEDEREIMEKMCRMRRTREEIEAVKKAQQEWKRKRMEEIEAENRKIEEYLLSKSTLQQSRAQAQAEKEAEREKIIEKIAIDLIDEREAKKERDNIVQDLREEELRAKMDKRYKDELEKKIRNKLETRTTLTDQMREMEDRKKQQQEEDRKYKEELIAKMQEDEKLQQLSSQKKRIKMIQLRKDAEELLIERRTKQAVEFQLQIRVEEEEKREAERRRQIIEEERIKMLKDHIQNLIGYLPKGLLRPEDLPHLSTDIFENFKSNPMPTYIPPVHRKR